MVTVYFNTESYGEITVADPGGHGGLMPPPPFQMDKNLISVPNYYFLNKN